MSETAKPTPGPWEVASRLGAPVIMAKDCALPVASLGWLGQSYGSLKTRPDVQAEIVANARLIAAAPELLACLKLAADIIGHPDDDMSKLIAETIAKAEGR